jgi:phage shock protein A
MAQDDREHEQLANQLEQETDKLEQRSQELGQEIEDTRTDWRSKRANPAVPGALEPVDEAASPESASEDESDGAPSEDRPDRRSST